MNTDFDKKPLSIFKWKINVLESFLSLRIINKNFTHSGIANTCSSEKSIKKGGSPHSRLQNQKPKNNYRI